MTIIFLEEDGKRRVELEDGLVRVRMRWPSRIYGAEEYLAETPNGVWGSGPTPYQAFGALKESSSNP